MKQLFSLVYSKYVLNSLQIKVKFLFPEACCTFSCMKQTSLKSWVISELPVCVSDGCEFVALTLQAAADGFSGDLNLRLRCKSGIDLFV